MTRVRYMKITHCIAMAVVGGLFVLTCFLQGTAGDMHMTFPKPTPDKWVNLVCNAKAQGSTPAQTANWLVGQYGFSPAAAAQHTLNHWKECS